MSGTTFQCQRAKTEVKNISRLRGGTTCKSLFNEKKFAFFPKEPLSLRVK